MTNQSPGNLPYPGQPQPGWGQPRPAPNPSSRRPWYKKKRFMIPIGTFVALAVYGSFIDDPAALKAPQPLAQVVESTTADASSPTAGSTAQADVEASAAADAKAAAALKERRARAAKAKKLKAQKRKAAKAARARKARAAAAKKKREQEAAKPAPVTVTPGAFCADAQAGDTGVSSTGNWYRCSLYPSGRYRWKRI